MWRPAAGLDSPATPFPPRPTGAAATHRGKRLPPRRCPHPIWAAPLGKWRRAFSATSSRGGMSDPRVSQRRWNSARSPPAPLPSPALGWQGPSFGFPAAPRARLPSRRSTGGPRGRGLLSYRDVGPETAVLPGDKVLPRAAAHPPEAKVPGLKPQSSPYTQALEVARNPAPLE